MAGDSETSAEWSTAISDRERGPLVTITTCLMLVAMFFFLAFRLTIRWPWRKLLGFDDLVVVLGSLVATGQAVAVFRAIHFGLGQHREDLGSEDMGRLKHAALASDILSIIALTCSKLAVSLLILRLSTFKRHVLAARIITVLICIWGIIATTSSSIAPANVKARKDGWIGVGAYSVVLETFLFLLPIYLVWSLQMRLSAKLTIISGFAFRIPASALALARVLAVAKMLSIEASQSASTIDLSWDYVRPTIFAIIEVNYSLMAATIPCMHLFLRQFSTGYLGTTLQQVEPSIGGGTGQFSSTGTTKGASGSRSDSYILSSLRSSDTRHTITRTRRESHINKHGARETTRQRSGSGDEDLLKRNDGNTTTTCVIHPDQITTDGDGGSRVSVLSSGSDGIVVRQTVEVRWEDDAPRAAERALLQR